MHTHTPTFLLLQRSFSPRRGNTITGRTERNSLDGQETTGTCRSSVAQSVHRRCVSRRKTIKQVWNSVKSIATTSLHFCVCRSVARDMAKLSSLGVTHVLNAAAGRYRINTGPHFYSDLGVEYHGVEAADHPEFSLQPFFRPAAQFIDSALKKHGQ